MTVQQAWNVAADEEYAIFVALEPHLNTKNATNRRRFCSAPTEAVGDCLFTLPGGILYNMRVYWVLEV
jgi:hypothetical protein